MSSRNPDSDSQYAVLQHLLERGVIFILQKPLDALFCGPGVRVMKGARHSGLWLLGPADPWFIQSQITKFIHSHTRT